MSRISSLRLLGAAALAGAAVVTTAAAAPASADESDITGHVYAATNAASGNAIQVYDRSATGILTTGEVVPTGGLGLGASLGSQGGVVRDGRILLVVNGGDDTVSSLRITRNGLRLVDVAPSGGDQPISVTVHDGLVYVVNAASDTISGLRMEDDGDLRPLADSTRPLSGAGVAAGQISFSDDGRTLVVSEKGSNSLSTYRVRGNGLATGPTVTPSLGTTPFGFDFGRDGLVVVSEAGTGSVSSYRLARTTLSPVSGPVPDTQRAACWLEISKNGKYAYTTNAASNTISSYRIARDGTLSLLAEVASVTGAGPTDIAQSPDGQFLFSRMRDGSIESYRISADGSLTPLGSAIGAASVGTAGLAAS